MTLFDVLAAGRTDNGPVRENNEDAFHVGDSLLVVADGVGGAAAGEVASQTAVSVFAGVRHARTRDDLYQILADSVDRSTAEINDLVRRDPLLDGMGTTATAMMWCSEAIVVAQIGDSRAYYLPRNPREPMCQITKDDSFVQYLIDRGLLGRDEAAAHAHRNVILKAINGMRVTPTFCTMAPLIGDRYLLCSDGLSDYVPDAEIERVLRAAAGPGEAAASLIEEALRRHTRDNVTVIVADIVPPVGGAD